MSDVKVTDLGGGAELREYASGTREGWLNGQRHRADGPAIEWANGTREWWLNDVKFSEQEWRQKTGHSPSDEMSPRRSRP